MKIFLKYLINGDKVMEISSNIKLIFDFLHKKYFEFYEKRHRIDFTSNQDHGITK